MKLLLENWREYLNEGELPKFLYHGTSMTQYDRIKSNEYDVKRLYLADSWDKSAGYAEKQAVIDDDEESIILKINTSMLDGDIIIDPGSNPEELKYDMGQWIYTGNIGKAIVDEDIG